MSDLRSRARQETQPGSDVARVAQPDTLTVRIRQMEEQFRMAAPKGVEAVQLVRDSLTCLRTVRNLDRAEPMSVLGALMTAAQLGLRPGVLGHCWPLPFWDRNLAWVDPETGKPRTGGYRAQFVIGYQGLVELAYRSGRVASIVARTVHENDLFDVDLGVADNLIHKPLMKGDRGPESAYYVVVKYAAGGHAFWYLTRDEAIAYRERYAPRGKQGQLVGPWSEPDAFAGMVHKTCLRQLAKWMPKSTELAQAIQVDDTVRVDITPTADPAEVSEHPSALEGEVVDAPAGTPALGTPEYEAWAAEQDAQQFGGGDR